MIPRSIIFEQQFLIDNIFMLMVTISLHTILSELVGGDEFFFPQCTNTIRCSKTIFHFSIQEMYYYSQQFLISQLFHD